MTKRAGGCLLGRLSKKLLAASWAILWAASPAAGVELQLKRTPEKYPNQLEISGGAGRQRWRLRYGTFYEFAPSAQLVSVAGNRAWFSHGGWLRLIDTQKGLVIGRWHFPWLIVRLVPQGNRLQVDVEEKYGQQVFRRSLAFDPSAGANPPYWPNEQLVLNRLSIMEVESAWRLKSGGLLSTQDKIAADNRAKEHQAQLAEAIRRDPDSPWFQIAYARLLRDLGDPRAPAVFEAALRVPTTDFTELLVISGFLDRLGERDRARAAFERGYQNFFERGNDPRLALSFTDKILLYLPWGKSPVDPASDYGRELMERNYRVAPRLEFADLAWEIYADLLENHGRAEDARLWRARAREAARTSAFLLPRGLTLMADKALLAVLASIFAAGLYLLILGVRYWPQRRADSSAMKGRSWLVRALSQMNLQYWSRGQRVAFLTIVVSAWVSAGVNGGIMVGILRAAGAPLSFGSGSLAGPVTTWYLGSRLPSGPERDLLLAMAFQQSGEIDRAERLYRNLPNFAESWNNLGVLLKESGKDQEARQAFEQALRLDAGLTEAAVNLRQPFLGLWAELHQKYEPGRPMFAPPQAQHLTRAFLGASPGEIISRACAGPFVGPGVLNVLEAPWGGANEFESLELRIAFVVALVISLALFVIPSWPVTNPPGRFQAALEALFPGVSPGWSFTGGLALVAWCYFFFQDVLLFWKNTPFIIAAIATPDLGRSFGIPGADYLHMLRLINPNWVWVYAAPAVLFAVNFIVVLRTKK